jgi:hypothetical protein
MASKREQERRNTEAQIKQAHEYASLRVKYVEDKLQETLNNCDL